MTADLHSMADNNNLINLMTIDWYHKTWLDLTWLESWIVPLTTVNYCNQLILPNTLIYSAPQTSQWICKTHSRCIWFPAVKEPMRLNYTAAMQSIKQPPLAPMCSYLNHFQQTLKKNIWKGIKSVSSPEKQRFISHCLLPQNRKTDPKRLYTFSLCR